MFMSGLISFVLANYVDILIALVALVGATIAVLHALIAIFLMIPGPQPEAALQKAVDVLQKGVDFLTKFSKKPEVK
jgi:hypothetical protein